MTEFAPVPVMDELRMALLAPEFEQPAHESSWPWWRVMTESGVINTAIISDDEREREFVLQTAAYLNATNDTEAGTQLLDFTSEIWLQRLGTTHPQTIALQRWRTEMHLKGGVCLLAGLLVETNERQLSSALAQSPEDQRLASEKLAVGRQKAIWLGYQGQVAEGRALAGLVCDGMRSLYGESDPHTMTALRVVAGFDFMADDDEGALAKLHTVQNEIAAAPEGVFTTTFAIDVELAELRVRRESESNLTAIYARQQVLEDKAVALLGRESYMASVAAADRLNTRVRANRRQHFKPLTSNRRTYELWAMLG